MSEAGSRYKVSYSRHVRDELRRLIARAASQGLADEVIAAVKKLDGQLALYPQFGQPLQDFNRSRATLWIGVSAPLVVRYVIDEDTRQVLLGQPFEILPRSGFD